MDARPSPSRLSTLIRRISARRSTAICGRPPRERDFQRQYRRKPARCHRTRVSGRTIVMALRIAGNHRYSRMKNERSPSVSRTRPRTFRRNMMSCCRSAAFSASSRLFDLNGKTNRAKQRQYSAIIVAGVRRFAHVINRDGVLGTHTRPESARSAWSRSVVCDGWNKQPDAMEEELVV